MIGPHFGNKAALNPACGGRLGSRGIFAIVICGSDADGGDGMSWSDGK